MNRTDIVNLVSRRTKVRKDVVDDVVGAFLETVSRAAALGEEVSLRGFGKFQQRTKPPVQLKNPRSGAPIPVPARKTVVFLPAPHLKDAINDPL